MTALERLASRHGLALVEDCCQAHLAHGGRPAGRHDWRRGRVQLLPDEESRRARRRRRRRSPTTRRLAERIKRLRNGGQTDRYRHEELRHQLAARRDAGRDPARAAAAALPAGRRAAGRSRRSYRTALAAPVRCTCRRNTTPGTSTICSSCERRGARRAAGPSRGRRHRNARSLPRPDPEPAGVRRRESSTTARRRRAPATRSCRCRSIPA